MSDFSLKEFNDPGLSEHKTQDDHPSMFSRLTGKGSRETGAQVVHMVKPGTRKQTTWGMAGEEETRRATGLHMGPRSSKDRSGQKLKSSGRFWGLNWTQNKSLRLANSQHLTIKSPETESKKPPNELYLIWKAHKMIFPNAQGKK